MILLVSPSKYLLQILSIRFENLDKGVELDWQWVEFYHARYHSQVPVKSPHLLLLSVSFSTPPPENVFLGGLPHGAIEAVKVAYGMVVQILDPPRDGFNLTVKLNFSKLPPDEENRYALFVNIASVREVVLGAPLRVVLKHLSSRTLASDVDKLVALVHQPKESFFLAPWVEKVTTIFPMRFKDSMDTVLTTSFLQCSEGFMHTQMRRHVESLIEALDHARPDSAKAKKSPRGRSFKQLSLKDTRG